MKCDFCNKAATSFGSHASYQACNDHVEKGEVIEDHMFSVMEESESESLQDYLEFLRQT